ncbi:MAG TPA: hypothetical protein VFN67_23625 [Polyangiales bacterium]|jgi:hypothetical protein|nr:hypothetical protein [Polyangiales bacterium]
MLVWLLSIMLIVVALLAIPLRLSLVAQATAEQRYQVQIHWLFGLVHAPLTASHSETPSSERRSSGRTPKQRWSFQQTMTFVRAAGGAARARQALADLISSLRPQIEFLRISLGLEEPADTGRAFAILAPLAVCLAMRYGHIELAPSFPEATLTVDGRAHFTILPLQTLGILLRYAMSFRTLHAFYLAQRSS